MKNNKSLLNERQIRRFMKLAGQAPLSENFVTEQEEGEPDFEPVGEPAFGGEPDAELGDEPGEDLDANAPIPQTTLNDLVNTIADAIERQTGVPISVEGADEGEEEYPEEEEAVADEFGGGEDLGGGEELDVDDEDLMEEEKAWYDIIPPKSETINFPETEIGKGGKMTPDPTASAKGVASQTIHFPETEIGRGGKMTQTDPKAKARLGRPLEEKRLKENLVNEVTRRVAARILYETR